MYKTEKNNTRKRLGCIITGLGALLVVGILPCEHYIRNTYRVHVEKTESIPQKGTSSNYTIYTKLLENNEVRVFKDKDSEFEWKFNSSDMYAQLIPGNDYEIKTYGIRSPFLSWYENIVKVTPLEKKLEK